MSYISRTYRQRNAHVHDEPQKEKFFSKQNDNARPHQRGAFFQAKLTVNDPGDRYEKEADSVASAVVNKSTTGAVIQNKNISSLQRLATSNEDEKLSTNDARMAKDKEIQEKPIQRMGAEQEKEKLKGIQKMEDLGKDKKEGIQKMGEPAKEDDDMQTEAVQTKAKGNTTVASPQVTSKIESSAGKGNALPPKVRKEMSTSFGANFSDVRIHKDGEAVALNQELQAQAFTRGRDIYFNEGKFDPDSSAGKFLLAHELTHVVQQGMGGKNDDTISKKAFECNHKHPCPPELKHKKYALHWGQDTVCSNRGVPDDSLEPKHKHKEGDRDCCNYSPAFIEDYVIGQVGLDGAASCNGKNLKKVAEVKYNGSTVKVLCTDSLPHGTNCDQEIELSNAASATLNGGKADDLCPIEVTYTAPAEDYTCYSHFDDDSKSKANGCISGNCKKAK